MNENNHNYNAEHKNTIRIKENNYHYDNNNNLENKDEIILLVHTNIFHQFQEQLVFSDAIKVDIIVFVTDRFIDSYYHQIDLIHAKLGIFLDGFKKYISQG